jgi:hypothetical protein
MKYVISEEQYNRVFWIDEFSDTSVQDIQGRKEYIESILPKILKHFKTEYGDDLVKIDVDKTKVLFGYEYLSIEIPQLSFYFSESLMSRVKVPRVIINELFNSLRDIFDIDTKKYGVPLSIRIYEQTWKQVY